MEQESRCQEEALVGLRLQVHRVDAEKKCVLDIWKYLENSGHRYYAAEPNMISVLGTFYIVGNI